MSSVVHRVSPSSSAASLRLEWARKVFSPKVGRFIVYLPGIACVLALAIFWGKVSEQPGAGLQVAAIVATFAGVFYSLFAFREASRADEKTAQLIQRHEETQLIIAESPKTYDRVFELHVTQPYEAPEKLRNVEFLISTPAYGYHVLGRDAVESFRRILADPKLPKELVLFSPDSHYFHVANTLLWNEYECLLTAKERWRVQIDAKSLADHIEDILHLLATQVERGTAGGPLVRIWVTPRAQLRMSAFRYSRATDRAYLILVDDVDLVSDLRSFTGRAISLPSALHRQVIGDSPHSEGDSFFDSFKKCPYTEREGAAAALLHDDLAHLEADYLLLRTKDVIFDLFTFDQQIRRVAAKCDGGNGSNATFEQWCARTAVTTADYFRHVLARAMAVEHRPTTTIQAHRLGIIEHAVSQSNTTAENALRSLASDLKNSLTHDDVIFRDELNKYLNQTPTPSAGPMVALLYFILSSGFGQSTLFHAMKNRRG